MAKDRTNMGPESVTVRRQRSGGVSMALPRTDDGKVHKAVGARSNTSAAHYADAQDKVCGSGASEAMKQDSGR